MKKKNVVIVLPTFNESENIERLLNSIRKVSSTLKSINLSVLVVDDSSPDGTADLVKKYINVHKNVFLISGRKQGLGVAYIRGFNYAIKELSADIVFEMDADFSHNPKNIPQFIYEIENGADFVIGSRYIKGGSIPDNWSSLRKLNSKFGNIFARYIANLGIVNDCTGGYRAITKEVIQKINLEDLQVRGYAFQIDLLSNAVKNNASIKEIPIAFIDREKGESKITMSDIKEFIIYVFSIRLNIIKNDFFDRMHNLKKVFSPRIWNKAQFKRGGQGA